MRFAAAALALMVLVPFCVAPMAQAQAEAGSVAVDPEADSEARRLYERGAEAFSRGDYEAAIDHFESSYRLSRRPELLYNIGSAADRLRRNERALEAFEQYLAERPGAPNAAEVSARLEVLRAEVAASHAPHEPAPSAAASEGPGAGPWVLLGVGGLVAIGGAVLVGLAAADVASVEGAMRGSSWSDYEAAYQRSEPLSIAGFVSLGVGVALAAGGIIWAVVPSGSSTASARLRMGPSGLRLEGTF